MSCAMFCFFYPWFKWLGTTVTLEVKLEYSAFSWNSGIQESIWKSLNAKTDISIFINLRYLQLKLLKNKENNKKICHASSYLQKYSLLCNKWGIIEKGLFSSIWWWTYFKNFEIGIYRFLNSNSSFVLEKNTTNTISFQKYQMIARFTSQAVNFSLRF